MLYRQNWLREVRRDYHQILAMSIREEWGLNYLNYLYLGNAEPCVEVESSLERTKGDAISEPSAESSRRRRGSTLARRSTLSIVLHPPLAALVIESCLTTKVALGTLGGAFGGIGPMTSVAAIVTGALSSWALPWAMLMCIKLAGSTCK
ncbi:hypothetical protein SK128_009535 [Halocaridina rubra]|uniref:Uncharacterized protein n=1 Tax=Halocaridina rubra TaxID=373956 RepID=A0AAN8X259_HALRR